MANPTEAPKPAETPAPAAPKAGLSTMKMIIIGGAVFLIQTVVIYFIIAFVVMPKMGGGEEKGKAKSEQASHNGKEGEGEGGEEGPAKDPGKFVFVVKDVIVNPAGTGGARFLLATVGVETGDEEELKSIEAKEVVVRDVLNTILGAKTLDELDDQARRDALRKEIKEQLKKSLKPLPVHQVYFSKFIIQ